MRQALGATPRDIRLQFVTEAVALSTLGGLAGLYPAVLAARLSPTEALRT